ncbi:MAG: UvrD-helicase domain-containing protein [Bacteroidales bacterium]|nr:UvrD-helicase domain-containing protein [Bacteroidales bacterium]
MSRFVIYSASAGSGKTYTLVRQYIEIAISSPSTLTSRFQRILAITFTNKAANGMKERIVSQLSDIVAKKKSSIDLVNQIASHLGIDVEEVVRRCKVLQTAILHHYSDFSVCTIDSFVHRIVRTFAHDLRLPMNFNLSLDNSDIIASAVDELIANAGRDEEKALTRILCTFTESNMDHGKTYNIERQLVSLAEQIFTEEAIEFLPKLDTIDFDSYISIQSQLATQNNDFEEKLTSAANIFVTACDKENLGVDDFPYKDKGIYPYFIRLADGDYSKIEPSTRLVTTYQNGDLTSKSMKGDIRKRIESVTPSFMKAYGEIDKLIEEGAAMYNTRQLLLSNLFALALLGRISKIKDKYYSDNEIVHISEFNKKISEQVANEPAPFIYERIGSRYTNYLIDEFQDTSRLQWHNFLPLLDEAMTHNYTSDTATVGKQSLVVGDGKQAIYRFRQGDVRQFMMLPEVDDPTHGDSLKREGVIETLRCNRRTLSNIVEFNNRFFKKIIEEHFNDNDELKQLYLKPCDDGLISLWQTWRDKGGYVQVGFQQEDDIYRNIYNAISHQVDDLGYQYSDIMVLARDKDTLSMVSQALTNGENGKIIPVVSTESFIISNCRTVQLVFHTLKYIYDTSDKAIAVQVLKLLASPYDLPDLLWRLHDNSFDLSSLLNNMGYDFNLEHLRSLSLYDMCESLIRTFRIEGKDAAYLATFLGEVSRFTQKPRTSLNDLINHLETRLKKVSTSTSSDLDAVQLLTIHKAKGLEAKIVIYALPSKKEQNSKIWVNLEGKNLDLPAVFVQCNKKNSEFKDSFEEEQKLNDMDRINLLYVAMTRPKDKLLVFCEEKKWEKGNRDNITLLHDFVSSDDECTAIGSTFIVGEDFKKKNPDDKETDNSISTIHLTNLPTAAWENRVVIAPQSDTMLSTLCDDNGVDSLLSDSRRYGILIHDLLSQIETVDDIEKVVHRYGISHELSQSAIDDIKNRIEQMITSGDNAKYFAKGVLSLRELSMFVDGEVLRPDRVVVSGDKTWVVDFKTGAFSDKKHQEYINQVEQYASALSRMGYKNVEPVILYL